MSKEREFIQTATWTCTGFAFDPNLLGLSLGIVVMIAQGYKREPPGIEKQRKLIKNNGWVDNEWGNKGERV